MPKQPVQQRFRISCEVDVDRLGHTMVALAHIEGLIVTGSELITDVVTFKHNKKKTRSGKAHPRHPSGIPGTDVIVGYARKHGGKFATGPLMDIFEKQGRSRKSVSPQIDALMKRKLVRRTGPGAYVLLAKGVKSKANGAEAPNG
jgi:hypothetical protein